MHNLQLIFSLINIRYFLFYIYIYLIYFIIYIAANEMYASFIFRLDSHLVTCHRYPAEQHRCDSCPRAYAWRPLLVRHRAIVHGDLRNYPCENCPKVSFKFALHSSKPDNTSRSVASSSIAKSQTSGRSSRTHQTYNAISERITWARGATLARSVARLSRPVPA